MLYEKLAGLDVEISGYETELLERETSSDFTRTTTVFALSGDGETGYGEDVTYDSEPHYTLAETEPEFPLTGTATLDEFTERLDDIDFFDGETLSQSIFRNYRRWALESALLDLALKQADTNLGTALDRSYSPVRFVVSTRLGEPPTIDRVSEWLDLYPELEFKLDPTSEWTPELADDLRSTGAVCTLDLKGQYKDTDVDQSADPELYELLLGTFPDAIVEDPDLTDETQPLFDGHEDRVAWDYPIRGVDTVEALPWEPNILNIKPSRFGSIESVLDTIEYCFDREITMYGGGQFELGVGRTHLHTLASLFYPAGPNDIAPGEYNAPEPQPNLPESPLRPPSDPVGLGFEQRE
jgi:hypothetical protein